VVAVAAYRKLGGTNKLARGGRRCHAYCRPCVSSACSKGATLGWWLLLRVSAVVEGKGFDGYPVTERASHNGSSVPRLNSSTFLASLTIECWRAQDSAAPNQNQRMGAMANTDDVATFTKKSTAVDIEGHDVVTVVVGRTRVRDAAGYRGTVLYVGPVESSSEASKDGQHPTIYAGVEWDDPSRGRHDGTVLACRTTGRRVRYFSTHNHAASGSLVKVSKLDWGVALDYTLLRHRYVATDSAECVAPATLLPHTAQTVSGRNDKPIQLLGEHTIRHYQQLDDLTTISLRYQGIARIQDCTMWSSRLPHVRDLDLAGNLLSDWRSVWQLVEGLPLLERLSIASNHLGDIESVHVDVDDDTDDTDNTVSRYPPVRHVHLLHLNLHDVRIQSLATIFVVARALPNLRELILAHNGVPQLLLPTDQSNEELSSESLTDLKPTKSPMVLNDLAVKLAETLPNIVYLDCSQCHGFQWRLSGESVVMVFDANEMVTAWSQLPQLQSLSLDGNAQLTAWATNATTVAYPALEQLQVAGTGLSDWATISAWHVTLPRLQRLRWGSCPLSNAASTAVGRRRIVYLLPRLTLLNGSVVTELERRDAARQYYQRPWTHLDKTNDDNNSDSFRVQDEYWAGMYPELAARASSLNHRRGQSPTSTVDGAPSHVDFEVVNVTIQSFAASSCTIPPLIRRLPSHLTIGKLKALCARQFGLDIDLQELRFRRHESDAILEPMDGGDDNTLQDYGVPDGASIVMLELDLAALALQEQRVAESNEERTRQQEREREEFSERQKLASKS
jgi:tubulin-specific chaperone E